MGRPNFSPQSACREVFRIWLDGGDELLSPKNWDTVINVFCHIGKSAVASEINMILTEQW